jgi:hypothetical protein
MMAAIKQPPGRPLQSYAEALDAFRRYREYQDDCWQSQGRARLCADGSAEQAKALQLSDRYGAAAYGWNVLLDNWLEAMATAEGKGFL